MGPYCEGESIPDLPTTSINGYDGVWTPSIDNTTTTIYTFTPVMGECATETMLTIVIEEPTDPEFSIETNYCVGDTPEILSGTSDNGIEGTWIPAVINTTTPGMTNYTFTPDEGCNAEFVLVVTIDDCGCDDPAMLTIDPIPATCETDVVNLIGTLSGSATMITWSSDGDGMFDNNMITNPNYTFGAGDIANGNVTISAMTDDPDGAGPCSAVSTDIIITILALESPLFIIDDEYCENDIADVLPGISDNGIMGTWIPSNINTSLLGVTSYVFNPNSDECATSFTLNVTIEEEFDPVFNIENIYCEDDVADLLPDMSDNGIDGSWNPPNINTINVGVSVYTFTPDMDECASEYLLTVTVDESIIPEFDGINDIYCAGDVPDVLSGTSDNGVNGSWSPSLINTSFTGVTSYLFTPDLEFCADSYTLTVSVLPLEDPLFDIEDEYCIDDPVDMLPLISINGAVGTWFPNTIDASTPGTSSYVFTPSTDCFNSYTLNVTVEDCGCLDPAMVSVDMVGPICENEIINLNATIAGSASSVSWTSSGDGMFSNSNSEDPSYTLGANDINNEVVVLTATTDDPDGAGPCSPSASSITVTILSLVDPLFTLGMEYCVDDMPSALPANSDNGLVGTWSPNVINTSETGSFDYIFTPNDYCTNPFTLNIDINNCDCDNPATISINSVSLICANESLNLESVLGGGGSVVTWSSTGDGSFLNENSLTTTYTPGNQDILNGMVDISISTDDPDGAGPCEIASENITITIVPVLDPVFNINDEYCIDDVPDDLLAISDNGISGTWSPSSISTSSPGLVNYIFTPTDNCNNEFTVEVEIIDCGCMDPALISIEDIMPICEGESIEVTAILGGSASTSTWSTNGDGTFNNVMLSNSIYTPGMNDILNGSVTILVTSDDPDGDEACSAAEASIVVSITQKLDPEFTLENQYCQNTSANLLPSISENGLTGTWSPSIVSTEVVGITNYIFTPDANQCASSYEIAIEIILAGELSFDINDLFCLDDTPAPLPEFSDSGIMGSWMPNSISTNMVGTSAYIFSPVDDCYDDFVLNVTIEDCDCNNPALIDVIALSMICEGELLSLEAILGGGANSVSWMTDGDGVFADAFAENTSYTPGIDDINNQSVIISGVTNDPDGTGLCVPATFTLNVSIMPTPETLILDPIIYCQGDEVLPINIEGANLTFYDEMGNSLGMIPPSINSDNAGMVTYFVTQSENGCEGEPAQLELIINSLPEVNAGADMNIGCEQTSVFLEGTTNSVNATINWDGPSVLGNNDTEIIEVDQEGVYEFTVLDMMTGCSNVDQVEVTAIATELNVIIEIQNPLCNTSNFGSVIITEITNGQSPFNIFLDGVELLEEDLLSLELGEYELLIVDNNGCAFESNITIQQIQNWSLDIQADKINIQEGEEVELTATLLNINESEIASVSWISDETVTCDDCLTTQTSPNQTTTYQVVVEDMNGCTEFLEITIFVEAIIDIFIPNVISINGTSENSTFFPGANPDKIVDVEVMLIYDRWGNLIFENNNFQANDPSEGWDGTFNDESVVSGVYVYVIKALTVDAKELVLAGDVTVLGK